MLAFTHVSTELQTQPPSQFLSGRAVPQIQLRAPHFKQALQPHTHSFNCLRAYYHSHLLDLSPGLWKFWICLVFLLFLSFSNCSFQTWAVLALILLKGSLHSDLFEFSQEIETDQREVHLAGAGKMDQG